MSLSLNFLFYIAQLVQSDSKMDFKFRHSQGQPPNRNSMGIPSMVNSNQMNEQSTGLDRYARKTVPSQPATKINSNQPPNIESKQPPRMATSVPAAPSQRSTINRYYRSDVAPKNQFKQYLSDINNVFYDQRESLRLLHLYHNIKWVAGMLWAIMFIIFISLYFIGPFEGECPHNAECGVFVHCYNGFRYDRERNQCVLSEDLYDQIVQVCTERIQKARRDWGDQECNDKEETLPRIRVEELVSGVDNMELQRQLMRKLEQFLQDQEKQKQYHFDYFRGTRTILPNVKDHSWFCRIKMLIKTENFKLGLPILLLVAIASALAFNQLRKRIIAKKIYAQLRKRTIAERLLNISYAKADVEKEYGPIDEKLWELIDQNRSKDRDIGFLQDDFLYWKML